MAKELTLEDIGASIKEIIDNRITESERKIDLQFIKIEKSINELNANNKRHDAKFELLDGRFLTLEGTIKGSVGVIKERLNKIEETLEIERADDNSANKRDIERLQKQIDEIKEKLKAG